MALPSLSMKSSEKVVLLSVVTPVTFSGISRGTVMVMLLPRRSSLVTDRSLHSVSLVTNPYGRVMWNQIVIPTGREITIRISSNKVRFY